jgi:tape measure domain-containing protein
MNNTIEFVLRMRDMMSSNITRVSSTSQSAFNRMSQSANQVTQRNRVLGMSFNELQSKIRDVENTISRSTIPSQIAAARRELASLQSQSSRHSGNLNGSTGSGGVGIGAIAGGTVLGNVVTQGISLITDGIGSMIRGSMEKETAIAGMSTFIGKKDASDAYKNIQKDAEATPFDTASLLVVNRSLISAGLNARNARTDSMNLANAVVAVGGTNDTLTRMAANMQQIKTVGKATAMDIRQFGIAGINIYEMLARSTGKSINQVKEMDVTYEQLAQSMAIAAGNGGIYQNALNNAMNTQTGKWSNLKESITNRLTAIGDAFSPLTNKVMDLGARFAKSGDYVIKFANWLNSSATSAKIFLITISALTAGFVTYQAIMGGVALWTGIVTKAQMLWNLALTANPIGIVVVAIGALIGGLVMAYNKFDGFRAMVDGVWASLKQVGSNIMGMFTKIPDMIIKAFTQIPKAISQIFSGVGDLFSAITSGNFSAIPRILKSIGGGMIKANPVLGFAAQVYTEATKGVGNAYSKAHSKSLLDSKKSKQKAGSELSPLGTAGTLAASNEASGKAAGDTVSGAGPKVVNIHVGKFFDNLQFTTLNAGESATEIEKIVMECFARVVYNGSKMV